MDARAYVRYRVWLIGLVLIWLVAFVAIGFYWSWLPMLLKGAAVIVASVVGPDIELLEQIFTSYERYSREGL